MLGLMQDHPLLISGLIVHAERHHPTQEVVSRRVEGDIHRTTYAAIAHRSRQLAQALDRLGIAAGERVATLAWNGYRHLELYYGVSGSGRVLHTLNPRLHPEQLAWIINHADDRLLFVDATFLPLIKAVAPHCPQLKAVVLLADATPGDALPLPLLAYETLLAAESGDYRWPSFDERTASSLCYTSGTTGNPKGVLYSHRSSLLHTFAAALPDSLSCSARDVILPVVPMFHVNAWGLPYVGPMVGAKMVLPGPGLDGKSLYELFESEGVTLSAGVPTVWQGLLAHVDAEGKKFSTMRRTVVGGSACPPAMKARFENDYGVEVVHAWGMTEISPLGTVSSLKSSHAQLPASARFDLQAKQGRVVFGVDMRIVDPQGKEIAWDGSTSGELQVRGPWIVSQYFRLDAPAPLVDGWFPTGDAATIDAEGYMQITDRIKDVVKSGGEWISSIDVENVAMSHPDVASAACIGAVHPKWDERPVLLYVAKAGKSPTPEAILAHYEGRVAKWQIPDMAIAVEALPLGATGKVLKNKLRDTYGRCLVDGAPTNPATPARST